ncbi:cytochrome oxidase [Halosolutus amylolyticus]|uniref:Cytochrome oxidase n=1 Tax=Halosolutus amylolyticus TaxID=2932267 RepID=A0ABD5PU92_9EURY
MSDANAHELAAPDRSLSHEEYDPVGTLVLIALYFLVLVLLWLFTYFVEFLGNAPTPLLIG